jgi:hypothetical protein
MIAREIQRLADRGERDGEIRLDEAARTRCEIWTRVMGYHRPVSAFNAGKRSEHEDRLYFVERRAGEDTVKACKAA